MFEISHKICKFYKNHKKNKLKFQLRKLLYNDILVKTFKNSS